MLDDTCSFKYRSRLINKRNNRESESNKLDLVLLASADLLLQIQNEPSRTFFRLYCKPTAGLRHDRGET